MLWLSLASVTIGLSQTYEGSYNVMATKYTIRSTKNGFTVTSRTKVGKTTITRTTGGNKIPRTTVSTRSGNINYTRKT